MKKISIIFTLLIAMFSMNASAGRDFSASAIKELRIYNDGRGIVLFENAPVLAGSTCSTVASYWVNALSFDANTNGGKAILAMLVAAKIADKKITAYSTGSCTSFNLVENMSHGFIQ